MKINDEKRIVTQMIRIYCSKREGNKQLWTACEQLLAYAGEEKPKTTTSNESEV